VREPRGVGPEWFRKMDRNRDGDVSRKEWLFSEEEEGGGHADANPSHFRQLRPI
jgi:hypothetical protein